MPNFDPLQVKAKADEIVRKDKTKVEDARQLFLEEIMDWSDYYTEACSEQPAAPESKTTFDSIINLWIQFSLFEISLHQFKKAVEVFEKAIVDPIGCKSSVLFQTYAKFCIDRKKLANAQNVYIKALSAGFADPENTALWGDFLSLMHTVNPNKGLSIVDLYEAVKDQGVGNLAVPAEIKALSVDSDSISTPMCEQTTTLDAIESKEDEEEMQVSAPDTAPAAPAQDTHRTVKEEDHMDVDDAQAARAPSTEPSTTNSNHTKTHTNSTNNHAASPSPSTSADRKPSPAPERQYAAPDDLDDVAGLTPEQVIRIYSARPPMLFTALHKEPTSRGIAALTDPVAPSAANTSGINPGVADLEAFLGCKLAALPAVTPNMHHEPPQFTNWSTADKYLDLIEGMWAAQAFKERHFDSWITDMRNLHREQEAKLVESHTDVDSKPASEKAALKKKQHGEVLRFRNHCAVQQELLHALVNKALFTLLLEQQIQLAAIGFPRFSSAFVEKLQLYIQGRKKSANNHHKTEIDAALVQQIASQQELLCAFLSVRLNTVSVERARAAQLARPRLSRAASVGDNDTGAGPAGGDLSDPNYYDAEAKKLRKRRRIITQAHNDSYSRSGVSSYGSYDSPGGMYHRGEDSPPGAAYYDRDYAPRHAKPYYNDAYREEDYRRGGQYHDPRDTRDTRDARDVRDPRDPYHAPDAHLPRSYPPPYQQQSYPAQRYPEPRADPRERGGLYATVGGRGRGRGAYHVQVQPLAQGGPRQGSFATAAPQKAAAVYDAPLQNTASNPAVPLLQKLASLSNQARKK